MTTVLVTGASRGLGLEFCKQYAAEGWEVLACCRQPEKADKLAGIANVRLLPLDVADFAQIDRLAKEIKDTPVDVLINNAGIYGDSSGHGFGQLDYAAWTRTLLVNTQAPVKMAEAFLPHLQRGKLKRLVAISSQMGSIDDNGSGGSILYRTSKAALNAGMKSLSIDLKGLGIGVFILHPGWVKTDMGGPNALIDAELSVSGMRRVIADSTLRHSGCFLKYDGSILPW
ncbi:SDR family oxidoreductase [Methylomicrobium sp. RS1]|uniref:SDR family oxidoreductase n=1 Tax=Candidatus Methylomicrobium oryzae TaxID=2802053 RepID=UPI0019228169|nr:SDR family oxidoreductase [Methylomicrobium sp. RS1]MBL1262560.1 SDR family oxidoreductase [Methylomicrobium sp. RS1]